VTRITFVTNVTNQERSPCPPAASCLARTTKIDPMMVARGLTADVLPGNSRMMRIFERGAHSLTAETDAGVVDLTMLL
jgi:hypothetical protein